MHGARDRTAAAALAAGLAAVAVAGCGGSSSSSATTSTTQAWAQSVCSSFADWKASLQQAKSLLADPSSVSKHTITDAAETVRSANKQLVDSLSALERPQTPARGAAADTLETLRGQLQSDLQTVQKALDASGSTQLLTTVSTVTGTLATMRTQLQTAVDDIRRHDLEGEVSAAFQQAPACAPFTGR